LEYAPSGASGARGTFFRRPSSNGKRSEAEKGIKKSREKRLSEKKDPSTGFDPGKKKGGDALQGRKGEALGVARASKAFDATKKSRSKSKTKKDTAAGTKAPLRERTPPKLTIVAKKGPRNGGS